MKSIVSTIACLLVCSSVFADDLKVEVKKKPVEVKVQVQPKIGVTSPIVRPNPGRYYWRHPSYGWGYWYYPAPVAAPLNYYVDQYGRVVPNGYTYDQFGQLVPYVAPAPVYSYPYYQRRWGWWW